MATPNEFSALRSRARDKRDKLIAQARKEYHSALIQIVMLERDLLGVTLKRYKKLSHAVQSVIPRDESFTSVTVMASLEALEPGRVWRKASIDGHITRLRQLGIIRRIRRAKGPEPALYVREGAEVPAMPFEDMTLPEVIQTVLTRPMTTAEVTVRLIEAGYDTRMPKKRLYNAVRIELGRGPFQRDGDGKWEQASESLR
jgi:hypothetical protein